MRLSDRPVNVDHPKVRGRGHSCPEVFREGRRLRLERLYEPGTHSRELVVLRTEYIIVYRLSAGVIIALGAHSIAGLGT